MGKRQNSKNKKNGLIEELLENLKQQALTPGSNTADERRKAEEAIYEELYSTTKGISEAISFEFFLKTVQAFLNQHDHAAPDLNRNVASLIEDMKTTGKQNCEVWVSISGVDLKDQSEAVFPPFTLRKVNEKKGSQYQ